MNPDQNSTPQNPAPDQPVAPVQPQPVQPQPTAPVAPTLQQSSSSNSPGKTIGLIGFIIALVSIPLNFFTLGIPAVVGLVLSIIGFVKAKKAAAKRGLALAGIIISSIVAVLTIVAYIFVGIFAASIVGELGDECQRLGAGEHTVVVSGETVVLNCSSNGSVLNFETQ